MRALWLLHELGVEFELREWPFDKSLRGAEFLALNPAGRVPTLELDGEVIWESGAILEALCEGFPEAGLGRAPGHPQRNRYLTWLHFAETISQHAAALTQQHIMLREDHMRSPIVMQLEAKRIAKCYGALDGALGDYLLPRFSAADIAVGQAVYMARHFTALDDYPRVAAWYERITARPGFQASLPGDQRLYARDFYPPWDGAA